MESSAARTAFRYTRSSLLLLAMVLVGLCLLRPRSSRARASEPRALPGAAASLIPFYSTADFTAEWIAPSDPRFARIHKIAPFALRNQEGEAVSDETLRGKVYVATFFFSSCTSLCPKMLANLRKIQRTFREDPAVALVSHSVMPSVDSEAVLRKYAHQNGIERGKWHLLTGDHDVIYGLARHSYFAEKRQGLTKKNSELLHTENLVLVDRAGRIRGIYNATLPAEVDRVIAEITTLLGEP